FGYAASLTQAFATAVYISGNVQCTSPPKAQLAIVISVRLIGLELYFFQLSNDRCRTSLEDCLVNLCFQCVGVVGSQPARSKNRRGTWKVALRLCDSRL